MDDNIETKIKQWDNKYNDPVKNKIDNIKMPLDSSWRLPLI